MRKIIPRNVSAAAAVLGGFPYFYYLSDNGGIEENEIVSFPLGVVNTNKIIIRKIK